MLDVGAGTGEVIKALVSDAGLSPHTYVAFEPNPAHIESLTTTLQRLQIPNTQLIPAPFDTAVRLDASFDFVLFSHSLYWMEDPPSVFHHAVNHLNVGGTAMGILQGPYGVHTLLALFEPRFERRTPMLQNNAYSSHELLSGLRLRGLEPNCRMMPTPLDMTDLFGGGSRHELSELLSFCLQLEFEELPSGLRQELIDHVCGATIPTGDKLLWYIPNAVVTVSKEE